MFPRRVLRMRYVFSNSHWKFGLGPEVGLTFSGIITIYAQKWVVVDGQRQSFKLLMGYGEGNLFQKFGPWAAQLIL